MTEQIIDIKEINKENIKNRLYQTNKRANEFVRIKDECEKKWRSYFEDIKKISDKFELKVTPKQETFNISVYNLDENGETNYSLGLVKVGEVIKEYNEFQINYIGEVPPTMARYEIPNIFVEEHITYRRGLERHNNGYKMKASMIGNETKYYKTAKKMVELVESYIESKWDTHRLNNKLQDIKKRAYALLEEKYKYSIIEFKEGMFQIRNLNGSTVRLIHRENSEGEITFKIRSIEVSPEQNLDKLMEKLVSL